MATPGDRSGKPCPHHPNCVGCPFIGLPYGEQLARKRSGVAAALEAYPRLRHLAIEDVVGSPRAFGYRNQAKLVVRAGRRGLLLGIYRPGTHEVVDIRSCPVHAPPINDVLAGVAAAIERHEVPLYDEVERRGLLRYVVVRASLWNKSAQVILVTARRGLSQAFTRAVGRVRGVASVVVNVNGDTGNAILGPEFVALTKEDGLVEKIGGWRLRTRAGAFLQANPNIAGRIYRQAVEWIEPQPEHVVFDLYCGAGALAMHVAPHVHTVFGIEASAIAVADAKRNARLNGIANTRFQAADVAVALPQLAAAVTANAIILNPPRKGAGEAVLAAIGAAAPERIVYVSCHPASLARDLDALAELGYATTTVRAFDMMPQTEHVECVARLVREGAPTSLAAPASAK